MFDSKVEKETAEKVAKLTPETVEKIHQVVRDVYKGVLTGEVEAGCYNEGSLLYRTGLCCGDPNSVEEAIEELVEDEELKAMFPEDWDAFDKVACDYEEELAKKLVAFIG